MPFPLTYEDLRIWLVINAILFLVTSELLLSYHGRTFIIGKKGLRIVALLLGIIFLITVLIQFIETSTIW
jgi:hypothetical protein